MIYLYSGTPGSGKSYHAVADIYYRLKRKGKKSFNRVIANFPIAMKTDSFQFLDNEDMTIEYLIGHAKKYHKPNIEGQTLIVIDECQLIFNSRSWQSDGASRMEWIKFFSQHRKLGYNIILIAQFDRMIDRQIRCLIEYEVAHMKINNFFHVVPVTTFLAVTRWYGQRMKVGHEVIMYRSKIGKFYDSYKMFENDSKEVESVGGDSGAPMRVRFYVSKSKLKKVHRNNLLILDRVS